MDEGGRRGEEEREKMRMILEDVLGK